MAVLGDAVVQVSVEFTAPALSREQHARLQALCAARKSLEFIERDRHEADGTAEQSRCTPMVEDLILAAQFIVGEQERAQVSAADLIGGLGFNAGHVWGVPMSIDGFRHTDGRCCRYQRSNDGWYYTNSENLVTPCERSHDPESCV